MYFCCRCLSLESKLNFPKTRARKYNKVHQLSVCWAMMSGADFPLHTDPCLMCPADQIRRQVHLWEEEMINWLRCTYETRHLKMYLFHLLVQSIALCPQRYSFRYVAAFITIHGQYSIKIFTLMSLSVSFCMSRLSLRIHSAQVFFWKETPQYPSPAVCHIL